MVDEPLKRQELVCESLDEIDEVAEQLIAFGRDVNIWLFEGEMGAGKTTLIKSICAQLGVEDTVNSPTFSIVNEYQSHNEEVIYHFDFYRIKDESEATEIGAEEYFDSGAYCFIEWPSKVENILPEEVLNINISVTGKTSRKIQLSRYE
ncbi:MAG: tRNA (adenosine(37)-N6)-threonylcarbamoyltransferase complex ATPase subunit type 1 TsaE [Fulvivirga sp.]